MKKKIILLITRLRGVNELKIALQKYNYRFIRIIIILGQYFSQIIKILIILITIIIFISLKSPRAVFKPTQS